MIKRSIFKNLLLTTSAVLMSVACIFSFMGLSAYLKKENDLFYEGMFAIIYMALYSSVLWISFFIFYIWPKVKVNPKNKTISSIPFFIMACFILYIFIDNV